MRHLAIVFVATLSPVFCERIFATTILNFEPASSFVSDAAPPTGYGDYVSSPGQGGFAYGGAGDTANVEVDFYNKAFYSTDYGSLQNVLYAPFGTTQSSVTFTATPGYSVTLVSFDVAGYQGDTSIDTVQISTIDGGVQQTLLNVAAPGTGFNTINVNVTGTMLSFTFNDDTAPDFIGLDNIVSFQSEVPEPASGLLLAVGMMASGMLAARRRI